MECVHDAEEKRSDTNKQEVIVIHELAGVPGDHEDAEGDGDAEDFHDAMEEEITVQASQMKSDDEEAPKQNRNEEVREDI